jgi:drug/metabolite transporter (DMT)-like permease
MRFRGYISIFAAAFFWGSSGTAARYLFEHHISTLLVVESRVIISTVLLIVLLVFLDRKLLNVKLIDLWGFFLLGVIGVAGSNYTYYEAIKETNVGLAILMQYTAPVLVTAYAIFSKTESVDRVKIAAIVLSIFGCAIMLGLFDKGIHITSRGIFLGILSSFCFAFFNVYNRIASKDYSIWGALAYTLIGASAFWIVFDFFTYLSRPTADLHLLSLWSGLSLVVFSISSILIPYFFYFNGLKILVPSTAVIVSTLEPVVAIVTAFFALGETLRWMQFLGGVFIIAAVILLEVYRE